MKNGALEAHRRLIGAPPRLDFISASLCGNFRTSKNHIVDFVLQTVTLFFICAFKMNSYISSALSL